MKRNPLHTCSMRTIGLLAIALILAGCHVIATFNGNGKINFQPGVHDTNWVKLTTITDSMMFMGGWGKATTEQEISKYGFSLQTSWFSVRHVTPDDGFSTYQDIWNYIDMGVDANGVRTSVVHTWCVINYHYQKLSSPTPTIVGKGKYKCRIILRSAPQPSGQIKQRIEMTIYTTYPTYTDVDQLKVTLEGIQPNGPLSIVYI